VYEGRDVAATASKAHVAEASGDLDDGLGLGLTRADAVRDWGQLFVEEKGGYLFPIN
jgi:hypothetical protein